MVTSTESSRPSNLPYGRWLGDFAPPLSAAEQNLVAKCAKGELCSLSSERPEEANKANTVRAELIRFLALGGDAAHPVHERGVRLEGAWISESLDLSNCKVKSDLKLFRCHFAKKIVARNASLASIDLSGSAIPGLNADGIRVVGDIFLKDKFSAKGEVRLLGASIGGDLTCSGGSFDNANGKALSADRMTVAGSIFLTDKFSAKGEVRLPGASIGGTLTCSGGSFDNANGKALGVDRITVVGSIFLNDTFSAKGEVRLLGASIRGTLTCSGGSFDNANGKALNTDRMTVAGSVFLKDNFSAKGEVRLLGASIGGDLTCSGGSFDNANGKALNLKNADVKGSMFLRNAQVTGAINLAAARVRTLCDGTAHETAPSPPSCWGSGGHILDGFTYDRIVNGADARTRIAWLKSQRDNQLNTENWAPQPWEQLIKVLREMGHPHEAAQVAIEKQHMMRKAGKIGEPVQFATASNPKDAVANLISWGHGWLSCKMRNGLHRLSGVLIGYGYNTTRALMLLPLMAVAFGAIYKYGYDYGYFGPTNAIIQMHYHDMCGAPGDIQSDPIPGRPHVHPAKRRWNDPQCTPPEYTSFQPWFYSFDVILPVVSLGQDGDWSPIVADAHGNDLWPGVGLRALVVVEILFGWATTLLLAAVMTNMIKRD